MKKLTVENTKDKSILFMGIEKYVHWENICYSQPNINLNPMELKYIYEFLTAFIFGTSCVWPTTTDCQN